MFGVEPISSINGKQRCLWSLAAQSGLWRGIIWAGLHSHANITARSFSWLINAVPTVLGITEAIKRRTWACNSCDGNGSNVPTYPVRFLSKFALSSSVVYISRKHYSQPLWDVEFVVSQCVLYAVFYALSVLRTVFSFPQEWQHHHSQSSLNLQSQRRLTLSYGAGKNKATIL